MNFIVAVYSVLSDLFLNLFLRRGRDGGSLARPITILVLKIFGIRKHCGALFAFIPCWACCTFSSCPELCFNADLLVFIVPADSTLKAHFFLGHSLPPICVIDPHLKTDFKNISDNALLSDPTSHYFNVN